MQNEQEEGWKEHQKERNQFIREQIRPVKKRRLIRWLKRFGILSLTAVVFGMIAGGIMVYFQKYLLRQEEITSVYTLATDIPEVTATPKAEEKSEVTAESKVVEEGIRSFAEWNRLTQRMAAVGSNKNSSLVGIRRKSSAQSLLNGSGNSLQQVYGLIIQQTKNYYYILTTQRIVEEQSSVVVQLPDNTSAKGEILGSDTQLNMAVVRLSKKDLHPELVRQLSVAEFGSGKGLVNGTNVIAVGCPNGVLRSVIVGRITNDSIRASITDGEVQLYCTDMPYSEEENGVILDVKGKVIGVISRNFEKETGNAGLAFIQIPDIKMVIELLKRKQNAAYLGIEGRSLSKMAAEANQLPEGAYVTEVYSGSPAYDSGMRVADVILEVDNTEVGTMSDIYQSLLEHRPGDVITYTVSRQSGRELIQKKLEIVLE